MKRLLFVVFSAGFCFLATAQDTLRNEEPRPRSHDFSYKSKWEYYEIRDTIAARVIEHYPAMTLCGVVMVASMSIVVTETGDTIRVIDICNLSFFNPGQAVRIAPAEKMESWCCTPFTLKQNEKTKEFEPVHSDVNILKTTWGRVVAISD